MAQRSWSVQDAKNRFSEVVEAARRMPQTVTKHGKPVARLIPASADCADLIGSMKGKIRVHGNILSTGLSWDA